MALHSKWSSGDLIFYDGLQNILTIKSGTDGLEFGADSSGADIKFFGDTTSAYMGWDASNDELVFDLADIAMGDTDFIMFGDDDDITLAWDTDSFNIVGAATSVNADVEFGTAAIPLSVKFFGTSGGTDTLAWSSSGSELIFAGTDISMGDDDEIRLGDDDDFVISCTSTGVLNIIPGVEENIINVGSSAGNLSVDMTIWGNDNAHFLVWDSSADELDVTATIEMQTTEKIQFGDTNCYINQSSGASLAIVSDGVIYLNGEIIHAAPTIVAIGDLSTQTIAVTSNRFQFVNSTGARNILLPSASGATCIGVQFFIANASTGAATLSVYNGTSGEEIIAEIAQFESATLVNDGVLWRGIVATAT